MSSSKFLLNSTFFRTLMKSRRGYAADNVKVVPSTTAAVRKNKDESGDSGEKEDESGDSGEKKEEDQVYWMRDQTGCWVPETHFGDVCVAELRERLLSKNYNNKK